MIKIHIVFLHREFHFLGFLILITTKLGQQSAFHTYSQVWACGQSGLWSLTSQWNLMSLPQYKKQKSETLVHRLQTANNFMDVFHVSPIQMPKIKEVGS